MPKRIQRMRAKGWRMPPGAIYVGRPTPLGNPYRVVAGPCGITAAEAVRLYREQASRSVALTLYLPDLRGHDLVCWCRLDQPCHADLLLTWANAPLVCETV